MSRFKQFCPAAKTIAQGILSVYTRAVRSPELPLCPTPVDYSSASQEAPVQGQLGEKFLPDLIREIAHKNSSGLLRLSRGKAIKAIFFESGTPTFAISNLTNEQLDNKLIKEGLVTFDQIERAKERDGKAHRLGPALVDMGLLEEPQMRKLVSEQVMGIVLSLFEWIEGDYSFDSRIRTAHEVTLGLNASDVLLEGARHAAEIEQVAEALVPHDGVVLRSKSNKLSTESGQLIPLESYILSRIESPITVNEVGAMSGLADADAHRAICALVAAGYLKVLGRDQESDEPPAAEADDSSERLAEDVARKLHFATTADYYDILGLTRQASSADVKAAYYHLAKKYHPDRHHQRDTDLRPKLERLFALITQAYDTLSQSAERAAYDDRIRGRSGALASAASRAAAADATQDNRAKPEPRTPSGDLSSTNGRRSDSDPLPRTPEAPVTETVSGTRKGQSEMTPAQTAELYYQQGRARFERKEYHAAVHLLREAIKLDPNRAPYHYHLGIALIRNPRTRRDAELHLSKAAELEPYNAQIRVKLGILYKEAGLFKRAEHYFREALQMDPDNRAARREMTTETARSKALGGGSIWKADMGTIAKKIFKK
jgi:curved DNA-binding protein CbpA